MFLYDTSLFIFRRDLRLDDNTALNAALSVSRHVIPCFIFDPRQIEPHPYQSQTGLVALLDAVEHLQKQLAAMGGELALYAGIPEQILKQIHQHHPIQAVFCNRDYTPFSRQRDVALAETCQELRISLHYSADALLNEPEHVLKKDKTPYQVFTAFYNCSKQLPVALPQALCHQNFLTPIPRLETTCLALPQKPLNLVFNANRDGALAILSTMTHYRNYAQTRDFPACQGNTGLSLHLKFGTCSIREAFYAITEHLGCEHPLLRQLYWRDFFTQIAFHFPSVFGRSFNEKFVNLTWDNNRDYFNAWREGRTGFPIVDAGMRELKQTGFMHNRVRMIVASFLVKDLHIDWRWGERYFAQQLVDYDPCVNNGNWQWAASTGCDAQPYFRIFNPWLQQQKFDTDGVYLYQWVPELKRYPVKIIHEWHKMHQGNDYPPPIVDHAIESKKSQLQYKHSASL